MLKKEFKMYENFVFDLDGTVWYWKKLIDGAKDAIKELEKQGKNIFYITGNSVLPAKGLSDRLTKLGLKTEENQVISAQNIILWYIKKRKYKKIFLIGEEKFKKFLEKKKVKTKNSWNVDCVILAQDRKINYQKLTMAMNALLNGIPAVAASKGAVWDMGDEKYPGTGIFVGALNTVGKVKILGKPAKEVMEYVKENYNFDPKRTILFGDEFDTDMIFAKKLKWTFAFVKTGRDKISQISEKEKPNMILNNLIDIIQ